MTVQEETPSPRSPVSPTRNNDDEEERLASENTPTQTTSPSSSVVDDDDMTEINIDGVGTIMQNASHFERIIDNIGRIWTPEEEETYEEQRREHLNEELTRVQRTNFIHFGVLCMVPIFLLVLVLVSSLNTGGNCEALGEGHVNCEYEKRAFMNAYASRCVCSAFTMD